MHMKEPTCLAELIEASSKTPNICRGLVGTVLRYFWGYIPCIRDYAVRVINALQIVSNQAAVGENNTPTWGEYSIGTLDIPVADSVEVILMVVYVVECFCNLSENRPGQLLGTALLEEMIFLGNVTEITTG